MSHYKTCISSTTKCFTNIELVRNICKHLNYEEQLKLLQVSRALEHIIVNFIWKTKFEEVEIYMINAINFLISDKIDTAASSSHKYIYISKLREIYNQKSLLFQEIDLDIFLHLNAGNIKKLHLKVHAIMMEKVQRFTLLREQFQNLTYLKYERATLNNEDLQKVAANCLKLETLVLFNCYNRRKQPLGLNNDIDIQIFRNMSNLKNLIIRFCYWCDKEHLHSFSAVATILNELKLQRLSLDFTIMPDTRTSTNVNNFSFDNVKYIKVFEIGPCEELGDFINFQTNILPRFESLCNLSLNNILITEKIFHILLNCCKHLTHLSMYSCIINGFASLPRLEELTLDCCRDITLLNLKTILNEMHLKCFKSTFTGYQGDLQLFSISPTLEKLHCDFTDKKLLQLFRFNNRKLQNLSYLRWDTSSLEYCPMRLSDFAPNIKVLCIAKKHLNFVDCYQMKSLEKVLLDVDDGMEIDVADLLMFLKHENLKELTIDDFYVRNSNVDLSKLKAFETNLLHLNVCGRVPNVLTDFCLDLLQLNRQLSVIFYRISTDVILKLINSEHFPARYSSINICGFSIDCISIKNQNKETMDFIELLVDVFQYPTGKCYLTLE